MSHHSPLYRCGYWFWTSDRMSCFQYNSLGQIRMKQVKWERPYSFELLQATKVKHFTEKKEPYRYSIKKVANYNKNLPSGPSHCSSNCTTHLFLFVWVFFKRCNSPTPLKLQPSAEESLTRTANVHKRCSLECTKKEAIFEVTPCPLRPLKHAQRQRNKLKTAGVSDISKSESSIRANTSAYSYWDKQAQVQGAKLVVLSLCIAFMDCYACPCVSGSAV